MSKDKAKTKTAVKTKAAKPVLVEVVNNDTQEISASPKPIMRVENIMKDKIEKAKEVVGKAYKDGVEKVTQVVSEASAASQANVDAIVASSQILGKGANETATLVATHTKASFERGLETARSLGSAKSFQEVVELQSNFAKTSVEAFMADTNKFVELFVNTSKEAVKPISERANAAISKLQAAE